MEPVVVNTGLDMGLVRGIATVFALLASSLSCCGPTVGGPARHSGQQLSCRWKRTMYRRSAHESGWSWFIALGTLANVAGMVWLLYVNGRAKAVKSTSPDTGHIWDGDLTELNNPQPRWWLWLFVLTIVWGLGYLVLYPGLGSSPGTLGGTSQKQHAAEVRAANDLQAPRYARFANAP